MTGMESKLSECRRAWLVMSKILERGIWAITHLGLRVNLERDVESRDFGDVVVLALALLLLELEGNATDGALLDTLHQVGGEARDFVAEALGWDDGLWKMNIRSSCLSMPRTTSSTMRLLVWKSRVRRG